jgi:hypothetical protein
LILITSVLTKASRTISKIVAKVKETGMCFCDDHCAAKVSENINSPNLFFCFYKKFSMQTINCNGGNHGNYNKRPLSVKDEIHLFC